MMKQYGYLRTNKFERVVQIYISCNVLYMMTQCAYLQTNKFKREVQIFISSNVLYMTTQVRPVLLQGQFTTCETHDPSNVVEDIARLNNLILTRFAQVVNDRQKFPLVIELIMNVLKERGR